MLTDKIYHALVSFPKAKRQLARVLHRLPHRRRIVERRGQHLIVDPSELSGFYLYYEREYDDRVFDFLDGVIGRYRLAIDIGANIGVYTCYFAARVAQVVAFEPDSIPYERLLRNLALNGLSNVAVHRLCVGRETGTVKFLSGDSRNRGIGSTIGAAAGGSEFPACSLDDFFRAPLGPCLIKMDIEGAEWLALQGARRLLSAADAAIDILLEVHPDQLRTIGVGIGELRSLLSEFGYACWAIGPRGLAALPADDTAERFWWASRNGPPQG